MSSLRYIVGLVRQAVRRRKLFPVSAGALLQVVEPVQPDVHSATRSVFVGCRNITHNSGVDYSVVLCDEAVGYVEVSGSDFTRNSLRELIPLLSRFNSPVIRLLFRCYSASA